MLHSAKCRTDLDELLLIVGLRPDSVQSALCLLAHAELGKEPSHNARDAAGLRLQWPMEDAHLVIVTALHSLH